MKRLTRFGALIALLLLGSATVASADQPQIAPLPASDFTIGAAVCGFAIDATVLAQNEMIKTFSDGSQLITGTLKMRLTNVSNGNSLDINISGPGKVEIGSDGSFTLKAEGRWLWPFGPGALGPGSRPTLLVTSGLATLHVSGSGTVS